MAQEYLSANEAMEVLDMPPSTFHRKVKAGEIKKHFPTAVSKHGVYDAREIARLRSNLRREAEPPKEGETDWVKGSDMGNVYNLEYTIYGDKTGNPNVVRKWHERNPHLCRILFNKANRSDLWGAITMLPMPESVILKIINEEMSDVDLDPQKDILQFDKPGVYNFYVASVIVRPDKRQHFMLLVNSLFNFWCSMAPEITIGKLYGSVLSNDGEMMAKKLFFSPLLYISDKVYMLDMSKPNPSRIVQSFQYCVKSRTEEADNHNHNAESSNVLSGPNEQSESSKNAVGNIHKPA